MRKLSILVVLFSAIISAQNIKSDVTHFVDGVTDKKWSNVNGEDYTKAFFSDFNGSCYVFLEVDETTIVSFETFTKVTLGNLEVKLIDENEETYFYCKTTKECENLKDITLEKGKKYRLYFTGKKAKGSYEVKWKIKSNL
jgi:hypothetical protein